MGAVAAIGGADDSGPISGIATCYDAVDWWPARELNTVIEITEKM